jgi:hypothetical protein
MSLSIVEQSRFLSSVPTDSFQHTLHVPCLSNMLEIIYCPQQTCFNRIRGSQCGTGDFPLQVRWGRDEW